MSRPTEEGSYGELLESSYWCTLTFRKSTGSPADSGMATVRGGWQGSASWAVDVQRFHQSGQTQNNAKGMNLLHLTSLELCAKKKKNHFLALHTSRTWWCDWHSSLKHDFCCNFTWILFQGDVDECIINFIVLSDSFASLLVFWFWLGFFSVVLFFEVIHGHKNEIFLSGYKYIKMSTVIYLCNPSVTVSHTAISGVSRHCNG